MKKLAVFAVAAVLAASAFAQNAEWIGNSSTTFNGQAASAGTTLELGSISSLLLGGSIESYGDSEGAQNPAYLNYAFDGSETASQITLNWTEWDGSNNHFAGSSSIALDNLVDGNQHSVQAYYSKPTQHENWQSSDPERNIWNGQIYEYGGPNYNATFTATSAPAVPEPATMSLLGLGALAMVLRRKLRK